MLAVVNAFLVVEESIGINKNTEDDLQNYQMKIFILHNDRQDKASGAIIRKRQEKDEKKEGGKELIFLKVWPAALERGDFPFRTPACSPWTLLQVEPR